MDHSRNRNASSVGFATSSVVPDSIIYKYKLVFLGDEGSGKTSILTRAIEDRFDKKYNATVGVDFVSKTMEISDGRWVRLQLWDTAGSKRFRDSIKSYIKDAHMIVVTYDVSNRESFVNATTKWIKDIKDVYEKQKLEAASSLSSSSRGDKAPLGNSSIGRSQGGSSSANREADNYLICLVGNKTDYKNYETKVSSLEGQEIAFKNGWLFLECSARAGYNVRNLFHILAENLPTDLGDTSIRDVSSRGGSSRGVAPGGHGRHTRRVFAS